MKKAVSLSLALLFGIVSLTGCSAHKSSEISVRTGKGNREKERKPSVTEVVETDETTEPDITPLPTETTEVSNDKVINLYIFNDEFRRVAELYSDLHPDMEYTFNVTMIDTYGGYYDALDSALKSGSADAPDIYAVESAYITDFTIDESSEYAATYEDLGIDLSAIETAKIAPYSVEVGTRASDNKIIALTYQGNGGMMIYRSSIAKEVFGTDDPEKISEYFGGGTNSWDKFFESAKKLKNKGYAVVSGNEDIWYPVFGSSEESWIESGKLNISPEREGFIDLSMSLTENGYCNNTKNWYEEWYYDMGSGTNPSVKLSEGEEHSEVFAFFGPMWLINYILTEYSGDNYGDWRVTTPPSGFFWGGTWIFASKYVTEASPEKQAVIADFLYWVTLDSSVNGLQYYWANGLSNDAGIKDVVVSAAVMEMSECPMEMLGGQNVFEYAIKCNELAKGNNISSWDDEINQLWKEEVWNHIQNGQSREESLQTFKDNVKSYYKIG